MSPVQAEIRRRSVLKKSTPFELMGPNVVIIIIIIIRAYLCVCLYSIRRPLHLPKQIHLTFLCTIQRPMYTDGLVTL